MRKIIQETIRNNAAEPVNVNRVNTGRSIREADFAGEAGSEGRRRPKSTG
jgi:hypothetical protein